MAASSSIPPRSTRRSRPPVSFAPFARARVAEQDGATTLALSLASVRAAHRLDVIALCHLDGTLLCSAGDRYAAEELAPLAARAANEPRARRADVLPRLGVIVETVEHGGRTWVLAATAADPLRDVRALVASIETSIRASMALPGIAAAARRADDDDDDDDEGFETALDQAFGAGWDAGPLAHLCAIIG